MHAADTQSTRATPGATYAPSTFGLIAPPPPAIPPPPAGGHMPLRFAPIKLTTTNNNKEQQHRSSSGTSASTSANSSKSATLEHYKVAFIFNT